MTKTFSHAVIYNGVFYPPNTPIEVKEKKATVSETEKVAKPKAKKAVKDDNA